MKKLIPMFLLSLFAVTVSAQESADSMYISLTQGRVVKFSGSEILSMGFPIDDTPRFPTPDGSAVFDVLNPAASVKTLLEKAGTECTDTMGRIEITQEQYDEIKEFTDGLVNGLTKQYDVYRKCFSWITANITYAQGYVDNNPYPVFKTRSAICQGYSNLLFVMLHSQGIPAMVVNGYLQSTVYDGQLTGLGHAWNYVCCDGVWYVSDPTNNGQHRMSNLGEYKYWLAPTSMDVVAFKKDDYWVNFNECRLNICKVTTDKSVFVTPYSVEGVRITCFNPFEDLPSNVREIYLGENIESLGDNIVGLNNHAQNVEYITVAPANKNYVSYEGVLYYSESYVPKEYWVSVDRNIPAYIPAALKRLELKAYNVPAGGIEYEKNLVYNINGLEEIVFPKETKSIKAWAVEKCPNLKVAYVPKGASVATNAFSSVHADFKIVYVE